MGKILTDAQVRQFHETGILSPVRAVPEDEANDCRRKLEAFEKETGKPAVETIHIKGHLYFEWAWKLARNPNLVGAIADLVGEDLFIMASRFWIKDPQDRKYVSWHQDHAYFGLKPLSDMKIANNYREFVTNETLLTSLRKKFEAAIGPIKNAGGVR